MFIGLFKQNDYPVLILMGFGILFLVIAFFVYLHSFAWYTYYGITKSEIIIRGIYSKDNIQLNTIEKIVVYDQDKTQEFVTAFYERIHKEETILSTRDWYQSLKKYNVLLKYCTVPFSQTTSTLAKYGLRNENVYDFNRYVILTLKNGVQYVLSPEKSQKFVNELNEKLDSLNES